jgi:hypothetical protein
LLKVATPFKGVAVSVPVKLAPPEMARVTGLVAEVTAFPFLSSTTIETAGEIVAWVEAFVGCCRKASFAGSAGVVLPGALTVKIALIAGDRLGLVANSV